MEIIKVVNGKIKNDEITRIVDCLKNGGLIVYPTDTIYGIGANAMSKNAIQKIVKLKGRKEGDFFSVMVDNIKTIKKYAIVGKLEEEFLKKYLPGSVTVILKLKTEILARKVFSEKIVNKNGAVGFRVISQYNFLNKIISEIGLPIISTSANRSGVGVIESSIKYVKNQFRSDLSKISLIIDAGNLKNITPSTLVDLSQTPYSILRRGIINVNNSDLNKKL